MDSSRAALIEDIRDWEARGSERIYATVVDRRSIALFREDLPVDDEALSRLLDERAAAPRNISTL
jgi:hypothetical protein